MHARLTRYISTCKLLGLIIFIVVEQYYRKKLEEHAFYPYYLKCQDQKQPISLETAYKAFDPDGGSLLQYKANQAQHKKDYHVWATRPLAKELLTYAAFDVASLRKVFY